MRMLVGDPGRRPSLVTVGLYILGAIVLIGLMVAIPALAAGIPTREVLGKIFLNVRFWTGTGLPVAAFAVVFVLTYPLFMRYFVIRQGRLPAGGWKRGLYFATACGLLLVMALVHGVTTRVAQGMTVLEALSDLILVVIMAAVTVLMLIYNWLTPSEEMARAIATGDYTRVSDERYRLLAMRSAHTALSVALVAILGVGSAVDILTYHTYPARSFIEAALLLAVWQASYAYWERKL